MRRRRKAARQVEEGGYNLLVAALVALLVPACGGGGEGQDYYVSVQQFESGAKGFRIIATPSVDVYATNYFGGNRYELKKEFMDAIEGNGGDPNSEAAQSVPDELDSSGGTLVQGVCNMGGTLTNVDVAYFVKGGETGTGYMYMTFQVSDGNAPKVIANVLGCMTPDQIIQLTDNKITVTVYIDQKVLVSTAGSVLHVNFNFNTGVADLGLAYNVAELAETEGEDGSTGYGETIAEKPAVKATRPFIAVDR